MAQIWNECIILSIDYICSSVIYSLEINNMSEPIHGNDRRWIRYISRIHHGCQTDSILRLILSFSDVILSRPVKVDTSMIPRVIQLLKYIYSPEVTQDFADTPPKVLAVSNQKWIQRRFASLLT